MDIWKVPIVQEIRRNTSKDLVNMHITETTDLIIRLNQFKSSLMLKFYKNLFSIQDEYSVCLWGEAKKRETQRDRVPSLKNVKF